MSAAGKSAMELLKKHKIVPNKSARAKVAVKECAAEIVRDLNEKVAAKGPSRNDLMLKAKASGIKYFRIMNKAELEEILLEGTTPVRIKNIQDAANARWHNGFGKRINNAKSEGAVH